MKKDPKKKDFCGDGEFASSQFGALPGLLASHGRVASRSPEITGFAWQAAM